MFSNANVNARGTATTMAIATTIHTRTTPSRTQARPPISHANVRRLAHLFSPTSTSIRHAVSWLGARWRIL